MIPIVIMGFVGQYQDSMEEKNNITEDVMRLKELPNSKLIEHLAKLSSDFDEIKNKILTLTYELDTVENLYNKLLKEYQSRGNA